MRILFMGSAAFAVASLEALAASKHEIIEVVTQPDKPAGRGMRITACPAAEAARRLKLPLYQPKGVRAPEVIEHFRALAPDLVAIVAYGKILPAEFIAIPPRGCANLHASLLPKYRGAAPINWAIANGERETGVTTQFINEELDAGDVLLAAATPIDEVETAVELHDRLTPLGADLLLKTIAGIEAGTLNPKPQDHSRATYAPILKKEDGRIAWEMAAGSIFNRIRGFVPWPGAYTGLAGKTLRIHEAAPFTPARAEAPGTVIEGGDRLAVACGEGALYLMEVQIEGKRRMSAADFLRGHRVEVGAILK